MEGCQAIADVLAAVPEVAFGTLFGSRSQGRERPDSDWDVAVFLDSNVPGAERLRLRLSLIAAITPSSRADVIVLNEAPPLLARRALQGQILHIRDRAAYIRFFVRTMREAEDQAYWDALHARERQRRLEEGRFGRP